VKRRRIAWALLAGAVVIVLAVVAFRRPLARLAVEWVVDVAIGANVHIDELDVSASRIALHGVKVERDGGSLLDADTITVDYTLRDLLPGGKRRYGLRAIDVVHPVLTVRRRADGTLNITNPPQVNVGGNPQPAAAAAPGTPFQLRVRVTGGVAMLLDPYRFHAIARSQRVDGIEVDAQIDTAARSRYRVSGAYRVASRAYPIVATGTLDTPRAYSLHVVRAQALPLSPIVDYFIDSDVATMRAGTARAIAVRLYALGPSSPYHLIGGANVTGAAFALAALRLPLLDLHGPAGLFDGGVALPEIDGSLGGLPLRIAGGLYDLSEPQLWLGAQTRGPLERLRALTTFSAALPVTGAMTVGALIENRVTDPVILARFAIDRPSYGGIVVDEAAGTVGYYRQSLNVVPFTAHYGAVAARAYGAIDLGRTTQTTVVALAGGPAGSLPYAAQLVPRSRVAATAVLTGTNARFGAQGFVEASGPDRLTAPFTLDQYGRGAFGPLALVQEAGGSALGTFYLARDRSESAFWVDARRLAIAAPAHPPSFEHLHLPALPELAGNVSATVGGAGPPSAFALVGRVHVRDLQFGTVRIAEATADLSGSPSDLRAGTVRASGPWGRFAGNGGMGAAGFALSGRYTGSLEGLEAFTGPVGGHGALDLPVAILASTAGTVVQTSGGSTAGASVRGIPFDRVAGTLTAGVAGVRILAASAGVAGGGLVAAGTATHGIGLSAAGVQAKRLAGAGIPLEDGSLALVGTARVGPGPLAFDGGVVLSDAHVRRIPIAANGDVHFAGTDVALARVDGSAYHTWGLLAGRVSDVASAGRRYDISARVTAADVGDIASAAGFVAAKRYHVDGSAEGEFVVKGAGEAPVVEGQLRIPESTVNGLFIADAAARVVASPTSLALFGGRASVGTTNARFDGSLYRRRQLAFSFDAGSADLSDFNNFFDPGDMLSGKGHVSFALLRRRGDLTTTGNIGMQGLRVAHAYFGTASTRWSSAGERIRGDVGFAGRAGALQADGSVSVPRRGRLARVIARSSFDLRVHATKFDVSAWTAALGYDLPLAGLIDAEGTVRGRYPALAVTGNASLAQGMAGALPIDKLTVAATSTFQRATITAVDVQMMAVSAHGSGSFGFRPHDPLSFQAHVSSPNIGTLVGEIIANPVALHGAFDADVRAGGTLTQPTLGGGFDLENAAVAGVTIPRALGEITLTGRDFTLRDAEIGFATGTLYLAGSLPLRLAPFGLGPPTAPISLTLAAKGIAIGNFASFFPKGSDVKGTVDGQVGVGGTVTAPRLSGELALAGGELAAPGIFNAPLQSIGARVVFAGTTARLETFHVGAGGGTIDGTGVASVPDLVSPGTDATISGALTFNRAQLDLAAYGKGQIDGRATLDHQPRQLAVLGGALTLQDAVIPFSALYNPQSTPASGDQTPAGAARPATPFGLPNVAFDLSLVAGRNVRVRSSVLDIGATGAVKVSGTLAEPLLAGTFSSGGGTITYFNRVFRLTDGTVTFEPQQGLIPILDARATTHVINPDPNALRNLTGSADITLTVSGPVTNMTIGLDSDPPYDRQQILGLLLSIPAIGGTSLFNTPGQTPIVTSGNGGLSVGQEAFGILNAQFTRNLLAPLETNLGGALGLQNLNLTLDYTGAVGISARKLLGKNIYAVYATTFGYPYRQTFGFEVRPNPTLAAQFTLYQTFGQVDLVQPFQPSNASINRITAAQPITGQSGFTFTLQRFFR
jgi:TamB, inner membrane protein subunit of TAM complex